MTALAHYTAQADTAHALAILATLRSLETARKDADKARIYCSNPDDLNNAEHYEMTARISLWQAIMNAGIDPDIVEGV